MRGATPPLSLSCLHGGRLVKQEILLHGLVLQYFYTVVMSTTYTCVLTPAAVPNT